MIISASKKFWKRLPTAHVKEIEDQDLFMKTLPPVN